MHYFHWIAGTILALAWFSRIVDAALGMPSVADVSQPEWNRSPVSSAGNPRVSIIVPARNEEKEIAQALTQLLALDYDNYEVIAVNDRSTDRTGEIMEEIQKQSPRLKVIHHEALPPSWLGKTHAMWTAANAATGDWLLFTDADVLFQPESLRRALAYAESENADQRRPVPANDHEAARRIHDDRLLPDDVRFRPSPVESSRPENERPHGSGRIQPDPPQHLRSHRHV